MIDKLKIKEIFFNITNIEINNIDLFIEALSHKSYSDELFYQRMEFLGDSILSFFSAKYVYENYPEANEGELSKLKTEIVNKENLANIFDKLSFRDILFVNEKSFKDNLPLSIKEDVIESLLGAIYIDSGIENAERFFYLIVDNSENVSEHFFAKNKLQEISLKMYKTLPEFNVFSENEIFKCKVYVNGEYIASAEGESKKECEKRVALKAIQMIEKENK